MTFAKVQIRKEDYQDIVTRGEKRIVHINPAEIDGVIECVETAVMGEVDMNAILRAYNEFTQRQADFVLTQAKANKIREIEAYDTSAAVNSFFYGNVEFWLDRDTRVSVRSTAEIMKEMGRETMTLWLGNVNVTLSPAEVLQMLAILEVYALECYNTTAEHKAKVNALATIEEVEAYNYTQGYPEKIHF